MVDILLKPKYTVLYLLIVAAAIIALAVLFYYNYNGSISSDTSNLLSMGIIILAFLALIATFLKYLAVNYRITDHDVTMSEGIITRTTRVVPVSKIDNTSVSRDVMDLILMTGSMRIDTPAGGGAVEIAIRRVDAGKVAEASDIIRGLMHAVHHKDEPKPAPKQGEKAEDVPAAEKPAKKKKKNNKKEEEQETS